MPSRARVLQIILAAAALGTIGFSVAILFLIQEPRSPYNECESPIANETFGRQWDRLLLNRIGKVVHVDEAAPSEWDRVFIFRAYTPASEVGEATHTPGYMGDRLFRHVPEVETLMVFMSGTRPVCGYAWRAGYLESQRREFIRAEAAFRVEKRCSDCPVVLYPGNAAGSETPTTSLTARFNGPGFALLTPAAERGR
jgi:hypothetical protein